MTPSDRTLVEALPKAALLVDAGGRVALANDLAATLLHTTTAALHGLPLEAVVARPEALAEAGTTPRTLEARRANGNPVRVHVVSSRREDGSLLALLTETGGDALAGEVQRFFDAAFDHAPIGMAIFDGDGRYVRVNAALCALLDRPAQELLGHRDNLLTHPDDRQADVDAAWRILGGEHDTWQCEKRFVRPDGSVVWAIANLTYLRDDAGDGLGWVGQFQDITGRREVEDQVRRERDYTTSILDTIGDGFALLRDGRVVEVNEQLCRLTGYSRQESLGTSFPYPWTPPHEVAEQDRLRKRADAGLTAHGEVVLRHKDGSLVDAEITIREAASPDGTPLGRLATLRDISDRKRQQRELQRMALRDALTGLPNRRAFHHELDAAVAAAQAGRRSLSLVLLDLDHFKQVNDRHGHPAGDAVLTEVARRLREELGGEGLLARIGGEELAWVLPGAGGPAAYAAAVRACRAVAGQPFAGVGRVTMSAGVCELSQAGDAEELYRLADVALYWAKERGRDLVVRWTPDPAFDLDAERVAATAERERRIDALRAVARLVDEDRHLSPGHAERVAELAGVLATEAGWGPAAVARLRDAALLHDVGKVALPTAVLRKPTALTHEEHALLRTHAAVSAEMAASVLDEEQVGWVRGHHERWDGTGYPDARLGAATPEGARIIAAADMWDAMVNGRAYRSARGAASAVAEVHAEAGRQLDPAVAERLLRAMAGASAPRRRPSCAAGA